MDNDPKHTKKTHHGPPQEAPAEGQSISFENLWLDLKRAVYARKPRNLKELEDVCDEEWRENLSDKN